MSSINSTQSNLDRLRLRMLIVKIHSVVPAGTIGFELCRKLVLKVFGAQGRTSARIQIWCSQSSVPNFASLGPNMRSLELKTPKSNSPHLTVFLLWHKCWIGLMKFPNF